jgi:hypothetical protein
MLLSRHQNAGQNRGIKIPNRCFENVAQFKYLGTRITNQNLIQEEIKRTVNSGDSFFLFANGVGLSPLYCGHFWHIVPAPDDR